MIISGKNIQSVANELIYPYLNKLLLSDDEIEVRETLDFIKKLADLGVERKNFLGLQKVIYHKNSKFAHDSIDLLRSMRSSKAGEMNHDVWINAYPFFCARTHSVPDFAIDSLKILDALIDLEIIGDYIELQKSIYHKSDSVAHFCLDVLRKIRGLPQETSIGPVIVMPATLEPVQIESSRIEKQEDRPKDDEITNKVINVLKKNPKYIEGLKDLKSKYNL